MSVSSTSTPIGYRIKTVSKLTGIARPTLIAWERRYGFVVPRRTDNGYRVYSDADVARLRAVKALVDEGHAISEAIALLDTQPGRASSPSKNSPGHYQSHAEALLRALLDYDRAKADDAVARFADDPFADLLAGVYFPVLRDLGDGWADDTYTVAQEHFATAYIRERFVRMLIKLGCGPESGPRVVLACLPGEPHELGLMGLAIRFALAGWRSVFLGANMPEDDLIDFVQTHPPNQVCLSAVLPINRDRLGAYAQRLREATSRSIGLAIGGAGLPDQLPHVEGVHFGSSFSALMAELGP